MRTFKGIEFSGTRAMFHGRTVSIWYPLRFSKWEIALGHFGFGFDDLRKPEDGFNFILIYLGWVMIHINGSE